MGNPLPKKKKIFQCHSRVRPVTTRSVARWRSWVCRRRARRATWLAPWAGCPRGITASPWLRPRPWAWCPRPWYRRPRAPRPPRARPATRWPAARPSTRNSSSAPPPAGPCPRPTPTWAAVPPAAPLPPRNTSTGYRPWTSRTSDLLLPTPTTTPSREQLIRPNTNIINTSRDSTQARIIRVPRSSGSLRGKPKVSLPRRVIQLTLVFFFFKLLYLWATSAYRLISGSKFNTYYKSWFLPV